MKNRSKFEENVEILIMFFKNYSKIDEKPIKLHLNIDKLPSKIRIFFQKFYKTL